MEQKDRLTLLKLASEIHENTQLIESHWEAMAPLLATLESLAPEGLQGMAGMINTHFKNAQKFKSEKVQKFEIESGLLKLKMYFQKLSSFEQHGVS